MENKMADQIKEKAAPQGPEAAATADYLSGGLKILLALSKYPPGSKSNSNIMFVTMPSSRGSQHVSSREVVEALDKKYTERTPPSVRLGEINNLIVSGRSFAHASYSKPANGLVTRQDFYTTEDGNHSLQIYLTGMNDEDIENMKNILKSLKFDKR